MQTGDQIKADIERALGQQVSEVGLRLALDSARMGVWERNLVTGEDAWSVQQEALFGLAPGSFATSHRAFLELVHPDDRAAVEEAARRAMAGQAPYVSEYRIVTPDGSVRWMAGRGDVVHDADGRATHMVGVTLDVTERRLVEQERADLLRREQEARQEAETASRLKDEFLATVSHELRMPLSVILGWAQMLRQGQCDETASRQGMEAIDRNAQAMARLVEDVLDVARIIRGQLRLEVRPVDPSALVDAALESLRPAAAAKEIALRRSGATEFKPIPADPDRIQQVVWNLLSNAIKFTPKGGSVDVRVGCDDSHVEIVVADNGAGISPDFLPHVFERFRQADGSSRRKYGGLGLGLAVVRHLVELHGGTVHAASPGLGCGATLSVRLPICGVPRDRAAGAHAPPAKPEPGAAASVFAAPATLAGVRVLVVDNHADARELMRAVLVRHGAEVTTATSAREAMAALEKARPEVLVSEIAMPGEDGYDLIRQVHNREAAWGARLAAVAVTGLAGPAHAAAAKAAGFRAHLAKPVQPQKLVAAVKELAAREKAPAGVTAH